MAIACVTSSTPSAQLAPQLQPHEQRHLIYLQEKIRLRICWNSTRLILLSLPATPFRLINFLERNGVSSPLLQFSFLGVLREVRFLVNSLFVCRCREYQTSVIYVNFCLTLFVSFDLTHTIPFFMSFHQCFICSSISSIIFTQKFLLFNLMDRCHLSHRL